jgi:restriction system protein
MTNGKPNNKSKGKILGSIILILLLAAAAVIGKYWDYWPWFAAGGAGFAIIWLAVLVKRHRAASTMASVDKMSGPEFERFLVKIFKRLGYKTEHVGASGSDFGADLIVERDGVKIAVQAKNYDPTNRVGNDAVQQAVAGAAYYDCKMAMVVTNSRFTKAAREQAAGSNLAVALWDRKDLEKAVRGKI